MEVSHHALQTTKDVETKTLLSNRTEELQPNGVISNTPENSQLINRNPLRISCTEERPKLVQFSESRVAACPHHPPLKLQSFLSHHHQRQKSLRTYLANIDYTSVSDAESCRLPSADCQCAYSPPLSSSLPVRLCSSTVKMILSSGFAVILNRLRFAALLLLISFAANGASASQYGDAEHITAILGEAVVLNCPISQPDTPYIIQWKRQHQKIPIYIWYDGYDPHVEEAYKGRASRVNPDTTLGLASLNLTAVKEDDQGWYECKVFYLDRTGAKENGTWIHLDVHAPPRFTTTPEDVTYVNIGNSIILNCEAEGTPKPEIFWFRDDDPVNPSDTVGIFNDGTELRINKIRHKDIGDYLCVARNAEGRVHHEAKVVIAGGAVIVTPPHNMTRLEGEKAEFICEAKGLPGNFTITWKREDVPIDRLSWLETRSLVRKDGTLVIQPTSADDEGFFTCEVSNGIGTTQTAQAHLNVEYPARVTYTPTVQYLAFRQQGIVKCHIKANPEVQFVTWIKDKRLFDPENEDGIIKLLNGSLLFTKVNQSHQGRYSCTPYNKHTTAGSSGDMEVLVREPPEFSPRPQGQYHGQLGEEVTLVCGGTGSPNPTVNWRRRDGQTLPRDRADIQGGNLTIKSLLRKDHGYYECEVKNEILTMIATTQLLVEGTTPHAPYNVTAKTSSFSVELSWAPGYPGGRDWDQKYTIWYRPSSYGTWSQIEVKPPGSTSVAIHNLTPGSTYEFQVQGKNELGDGLFSDTVTATTKGEAPASNNPGNPNAQHHGTSNNSKLKSNPVNQVESLGTGPNGGPIVEYNSWHMIVYPTDSSGSTYFPTIINAKGPKPSPPRNVTITLAYNGYTLSWKPPLETVAISSYAIESKFDGEKNWKNLKEKIVNETSFTIKKLTAGRTYQFRVLAKTLTSQESSDVITYTVAEHDKEKAVTAALVGGMLLCIVAIILSVCTVKICNKRKKKKQEKAYNMVACGVLPTEAMDGREKGSSSSSLKASFDCGGPSLQDVRLWLAGVLLGEDLRNRSDRRPLDSASSHYDYDSYRKYDSHKIKTLSNNSKYFIHKEYTKYPIPAISRDDDGKFILDKDSDEGGFTSPKRPARGVFGRRGTRPWTEPPESGWTAAVSGIESGVYHVRRGTTHIQGKQLPPPPHKSNTDSSMANLYEVPRRRVASPVIYENAIVSKDAFFGTPISYIHDFSPQFGRHHIPRRRAVLSPKGRLRSSSPGPLSSEWQQLAQLASFNEVSSVRQPSSAERSFPSTVLSSFHNTPNRLNPFHGFTVSPGHYPYYQLTHAPLTPEHATFSPLYRYPPSSRRIHVVGAEVHEPPIKYRTPTTTYHPYYLPPPRYYPSVGSYQPPIYEKQFGWLYPHDINLIQGHTFHGSGQHIHHSPQRNYLNHPFVSDRTRQYVNVPPPSFRNRMQQRKQLSTDPYALFKPNSSSQKPLATSSPPHLRPELQNTRIVTSATNDVQKTPVAVSPKYQNVRRRIVSPNSSSRVRTRHHSAPDLSSSIEKTGATSRKGIITSNRAKRYAKSRSHEVSFDLSNDASLDQSPNSSSGFGSKNTSQQQSSSQSGQSLSALGLDLSRVSEGSTKERYRKQEEVWEAAKIDTKIWPPPRLPPSYEQWLARQMQPQFRVPNYNIKSTPPEHKSDYFVLSEDPALIENVSKETMMKKSLMDNCSNNNSMDELDNEVFVNNSKANLATLDISVDDHYEFDTMLSPTPIDESLMPASVEWSSTNGTNSFRRLSDSELYSTTSLTFEKRRMSQEDMEERVAAMKQEFMEYRRRHGRSKDDTQLESVC